jgi:molecular chaperone IbpA
MPNSRVYHTVNRLFKGDKMTNANTTLTLRSLNIPSIHKLGIGFESMFDELLRSSNAQQALNYPPYNLIQLDENVFCIEVAVAGFKEGEIDVIIEKNLLTITGSKKDGIPDNIEYLHRGISTRNFERTFPLGPNIEVKGALIRDGMLVIDLIREIPENEKPKSIAISYIK